MSGAGARLVLASASPRRRALLTEAGVAFTLDPADVDESIDETHPIVVARALAARKALAVAARARPEDFVLGADTVVALLPSAERPGELLGKPASPADAARMLGLLSGSRHAVVTGLAVVRAADSALATDHERTFVTMRPLARAEIDAYVATGEWQDKAGGYAIQERAERFVTALEGGGFDNVVGLPVARALALLTAAGLDLAAVRLAGPAPAR